MTKAITFATSSTSREMLVKIRSDSRRACGFLGACATFVALAIAPAAHAYDGATNRAVDCKQAARDAWFMRQLQRTDGDVDPRPPQAVSCNERDARQAAAAKDDGVAKNHAMDRKHADLTQR